MRTITFRRTKFLPRDKFDEYYSMLREIGGRYSTGDMYVLDVSAAAKAFSKDPEKFKERLRTLLDNWLSPIGIGPDEIIDVIERAANTKRAFKPVSLEKGKLLAAAWPNVENYYVLEGNVPDELLAEMTMSYESYDPMARKRILKRIPVYRKVEEMSSTVRNVLAGYEYLVPRGLLPLTEKYGFEVEPYAPEVAKGMLEVGPQVAGLRDYQREVVESAIEYLGRYGAGTIQMATGAGKTVVAVDLAKRYLKATGNEDSKKPKVFVLALSTDLLYQFKDHFEREGVPMGLVTGEEFDVSKPVVGVTVQSLYRAMNEVAKEKESEEDKGDVGEDVRLDEYKVKDPRLLVELYRGAGLVIFDEAQHVPAATASRAVREAPKALRIAMSATPWRNDGKELKIYSLMGSIIPRKVTSSELIEKGYLVKPRIFLMKIPPPPDYYGDTYQEILSSVMDSDVRNRYITYLVKWLLDAEASGRARTSPIMVLVRFVKQGKKLVDYLKANGVRDVVFVSGELSPSERKEIFDAVRDGKIKVIVATKLADEGLDIPQLRSLIMAGATKSRTTLPQRIGRVVRPWKDKKMAFVFDIMDEGVPYLEEWNKVREEIYRSEPSWEVLERVADKAFMDSIMDTIKAPANSREPEEKVAESETSRRRIKA